MFVRFFYVFSVLVICSNYISRLEKYSYRYFSLVNVICLLFKRVFVSFFYFVSKKMVEKGKIYIY